MRKFPVLKCPICGKAYKEVGTFGNHMRNEHPGVIPEEWSDLRYAYYVHTGKSHGHCRECGGDTPWNETTGAYSKICGSEACRKKFRDRFMAGMRARYGKANLLDDPNFRARMLSNRRISGELEFADGGRVGYMGTLERKFLNMLDVFFRFPSADIMAPSPNRYTYYYENPNDEEHRGMHYYVPDIYIPSCNLEIELKAANNQRAKNLMVDVVKDAYKDIMMIRNPNVNYVKVYEEDYHVFFQVFADLAKQHETGEHRPIKYISRSLLTSVYREYIPDDCLKILDQYIYKYSEKSVLKKPANESDLPFLALEEDIDSDDEAHDQDPSPLIQEIYANDDQFDTDEDDDPEESVGVNPLIYYGLGAYAEQASAEESILDIFSEDAFIASEASIATEKENTLGVDTTTTAGRSALRYSRWRDRLFNKKLGIGKLAAKTFTNVTVENGRILIKGINCNLLMYRIKETFGEINLRNIFEYEYNAKSWKQYQAKKISRGDMRINYVYAPEFFALEFVELFNALAERYGDKSYRRVAELIYGATWLSKADTIDVPELGLEPLANIDMDLLDHQKRFIAQWPVLKNQLHLKGYILAFKPGKGKTLTTIGLAECLKVPRVYIVCPNNLTANWALEIKKYFKKYQLNEQAWTRDVCILGTKYGDPSTAKYIIVNQENIKLLQKIAKKDPNSLFVVDECHNFRNYNGVRSQELFTLADTIQSDDIICVSATPIKAVPAELAPMLHLIDSTFTDEAAIMYTRCFNLNNETAVRLVTKRFGQVMYRPADVHVDLPPKYEETLEWDVDNEARYYLSTVHAEIIQKFHEIHTEWCDKMKDAIQHFRDSVLKYSLTSRRNTLQYIDWVIQSSQSLRGKDGTSYHELSVKEFTSFIDSYVRPNQAIPVNEVDNLLTMEHSFIIACKSNMGKAIGQILPSRRAELFSNLYMHNRDRIYEMIRSCTKKTVFFSTMNPTLKTIHTDLQNMGIGSVLITGETSDTVGVIDRFRNDPNILVLVASSRVIGVGFTLTEASQLLFFGTPWRSSDYEQAAERIWRIGQTDPAHIYTVKAKTKEPNLSDRMQQILEWSERMFGAAITEQDVDGSTTSGTALEYYGMNMLYDVIFELYERMNQFSYGILDNGKLLPPEKAISDYKTLSPGLFGKSKNGLSFEFMSFQDFWLKSHGCRGESYVLLMKNPIRIHGFNVISDGNKVIYMECARKQFKGIYIADNLDMVISFIANRLNGNQPVKKSDLAVYHIKLNYGYYNVSLKELLVQIEKNGTPVSFQYNPKLLVLQRLDGANMEEVN